MATARPFAKARARGCYASNAGNAASDALAISYWNEGNRCEYTLSVVAVPEVTDNYTYATKGGMIGA